MNWDSIKRIIMLIAIITLIVIARYYDISSYFTFAYFNQYKTELLNYVDKHYLMSVILFLVGSVVIATLMIPVSIFLGVVGGFLFGLFWGTVYTVIGATIGATGAFLLVRHIIGNYIQQKYEKKLVKFNASMEEYGVNFLLMIHLMTVLPFALISTLAALTSMSTRTFFWGTLLGITPGTVVLVLTGTGLTDMTSVSDIFSLKIFIAFFCLGLLAALPLLFKKLLNRDLLDF